MTVGEILLAAVQAPSRYNKAMLRGYAFALWADVAGDAAEQYTHSVWLKNKKMFVEMDSASARSELFMQRKELADNMNKKAGYELVTEIILT
ncbi:hypothetical protein FACS1894156_3530 [Bacteroidia bacterium]|nr:hypothetical protein FACS1894156_3530 [Bacteroidia bacterium]